MPLSFSIPTLEATTALATRLAPLLRPHDVLALHGDLGAGKTAFARALLQECGVTGDIPSPTFTLVQTYETPAFPIHHFDLYRLKSPTELEEIGWHDALADGVVLVEWPERAEKFLPQNRLDLHFTSNGPRRVTLDTHETWQSRIKDLPL